MSKRYNRDKGESGERIAEKYLKDHGYRLIARNFKTDTGEIDLVVTDDEALVFVEVKARRSDEFGLPCEAVDLHKQRKINMVAGQFIKRNMFFGAPVRFDVIEVYLDDARVNHIENAFDSYLKY